MAISQDDALARIKTWAASQQAKSLDPGRFLDPVTWAEERFYVPDQIDPTAYEVAVRLGALPPLPQRGLVRFMPHQKTLLRYMLDMSRGPIDYYQTLLWSTIKKSGKTTVVSAISRWVAETWGDYADVICVGNDEAQARSRIFEGVVKSLETDPNWDLSRRELMTPEGYTEWRSTRSGLWRVASNAKIRPIACDYKGEAGANQSAACFTEIWGATDEKMRRLVNELTPPPTRRALRILEGYAGFEGESILWREFWDMAQKDGRRVTKDEIEQWGEWPFEEDPPVWVNENARLVAYIDQGLAARRMPWQLGDEGEAYYRAQATTEPPLSFQRLHFNEWVSPISEFIPQEWWASCFRHDIPHLTPHTPIVIGADASVTGDCSALVGVSRAPWDSAEVCVHFVYVWTPTPGHPMDYSAPGGLDETLRSLCARYDVAEIAYDPYQLHKLMTDLGRDNVAYCRPFNQNADRMKADKQLYDVIRDRRIWHTGIPVLNEHIQASAAKQAKDEDTRLRIIKRAPNSKIDACVALSMSVSECLRLLLD